jgi:hypothetical protein
VCYIDAVEHSDVNMVTTLLSLHPIKDVFPRMDNWTSLYECILCDNIDATEMLLQHGINKSSMLVYPLDLALKQRDGEKVNLLAMSGIRSCNIAQSPLEFTSNGDRSNPHADYLWL